MKEQQRHNWEQLDLPLTDENQDRKRPLDPPICKEVTRLLGLLLSECTSSAAANAKGACDEQDQR
jgi:hypothetical protein